jgi:hypothetical protein
LSSGRASSTRRETRDELFRAAKDVLATNEQKINDWVEKSDESSTPIRCCRTLDTPTSTSTTCNTSSRYSTAIIAAATRRSPLGSLAISPVFNPAGMR